MRFVVRRVVVLEMCIRDRGYRTDEDTVDPALEQAAVAAAVDADVAVIFAGLPERYESCLLYTSRCV